MSLAIIDPKAKVNRLKKVDTFVQTHGRGDQTLTAEQKKHRMEKYISNSTEIDRVIGLGRYPDVGVPIDNNINLTPTPDNHQGPTEKLPLDMIKNLKKYPIDIRGLDKEHRIISMKVNNDGSMEVQHLIIDGKEKDPNNRTTSHLYLFSDAESAESEYRQFKKGKLKEVSDRTMAIHRDKGRLNELLESPDVDTNEDRPGQI